MVTSDHMTVSGQCPLCWLGCENSQLGGLVFNGDGAIATLLSLSIITGYNTSLPPSLSLCPHYTVPSPCPS